MSSTSPVDTWLNLILQDEPETAPVGLQWIYQTTKPRITGIIFTGRCPHACSHCIFPPDYHASNRDISLNQWKGMLRQVYDDINVESFVYTGRSLNEKGVSILNWMKEALPNIHIGLIDGGSKPDLLINGLYPSALDWIDVSLDGMEREHDLQRDRNGSFKKAVTTIEAWREHEIAPKINILTCITTINQDSILDLILFLNDRGFGNIFLSPVSVLNGCRPSEKLKIPGVAFTRLIDDILEILGRLEDAWIEINLFDVEYMHVIGRDHKDILKGFTTEFDHLSWKAVSGSNAFFINYYPLSLAGTREFIINCNGDVIPPLVMARGDIPREEVLGSLLSKRASEIVADLHRPRALGIYETHFLKERKLLKGEVGYVLEHRLVG